MNSLMRHIITIPRKKSSAWYLTSGVSKSDYKAIYQAKGAASYEASLVNIATPGTLDLTTESAPTWDAVNGWKFSITEPQQILSSSFTSVTNEASFLIRFSDLVLVDGLGVITEGGIYIYSCDYSEDFTGLLVTDGTNETYIPLASAPLNGSIIVNKNGVFLDGELISSISTFAPAADFSQSIGGANIFNTQLFGVHDNGVTALTATQVGVICSQMAAV